MEMRYLAWKPEASYLMLPKCGNTSVRAAIGKQLGHTEALQVWLNQYLAEGPQGWSFTLIREPVERFISLWWDKTQKDGRPIKTLQRQIAKIWGQYGNTFRLGMSLVDFIDAVETIGVQDGEDHFRPYSHIIQREGQPNFIGVLGNRKHWNLIREQTGLPDLGHVRVSSKRIMAAAIPAKVIDRIKTFYAEDFELYRKHKDR